MCKLKTKKLIVKQNSSDSRDRDQIVTRNFNRDLRLREEIFIRLVRQIKLILVQRIKDLVYKKKNKTYVLKDEHSKNCNKISTAFKYFYINTRLAEQVQRAMLLNVVKTFGINSKTIKPILAISNN